MNQNMDQVMLDYYPEYQMLKKLQSLTFNFTCNKCWKVLTFEKFFDDDHECLLDDDSQPNQAPQDEQHLSLEVEEFKGYPPDTALHRNDLQSKSGISSDKESYFIQSANMYTFNMGADKKRDSSSEYFKLQNQNAKLKKQGTEQNLKSNKISEKGIPRHEVKIDKVASQQSKPISNMRSSELEMSLEADIVQDKGQSAAQNGFLQNNTKRQNIYIKKKCIEYITRIDKLTEELTKCKTENESLIFDLRECKTKMAFLEEKKAMLQIELAKEKNKRILKQQSSRHDETDDAGADEDKNINLTVHSQPNWGGCFPMCGGKQKMTMKVTPAL